MFGKLKEAVTLVHQMERVTPEEADVPAEKLQELNEGSFLLRLYNAYQVQTQGKEGIGTKVGEATLHALALVSYMFRDFPRYIDRLEKAASELHETVRQRE
ncbi:MAG TPA: hypothetical protein VLH19_00540 [Patescibacteria group bacterium]|nr:hypothetical protein [Patescibacteria group bacterium]